MKIPWYVFLNPLVWVVVVVCGILACLAYLAISAGKVAEELVDRWFPS